MIDKIVLGITSILLIVGVAYIYSNDNDDKNRIATNVVEANENQDYKIIRDSNIDEIQKNLVNLEQDFEDNNGLHTHFNDLKSGIDFNISGITNDNSEDSITELIDSDAFKSIEEYTGKNIGDDITEFFDDEYKNDRVSRVYSDCNTTLYMEKYKNGEEGYAGDITIRMKGYEVKNSYYQDIDKMIRGDGYSLISINQADGSSEMRYQDIGFVRDGHEVCIVDDVEINGVIVDLRIVTKNNEISEVSLLGKSRVRDKEDIIITEYQSELISRLVAALGIPKAEEEIRELLFNSDITKTMPEVTEGDGYGIKSSYVVRDGGNDSKYYHTRLDIRAK